MGKKSFTLSLIAILFVLIAALAVAVAFFLSQREKTDQITLYGNVDVRQVDIGFRVFGRVTEMPFEEGDFVPKGALMASIDKQPYADQTIEAAANVKGAQISYENAKQIFKRRQELVNEGSVSQEDYENSLASKEVYAETLKQMEAAFGVAMTNLKDTDAYCPADGTILTRVREPGAVVLQGDPVYTLSLVSPVWIRAYVTEPLLGKIYPGMEAENFTDTPDGTVYKGKIGFISPVAEFTPKTVETTQLRTDLVYRIRVYADNPDWGLKQGMPVTLKLSPEKHHDRSYSHRQPNEKIRRADCSRSNSCCHP